MNAPVPADYATNLALEIMADVQRYSFTDALNIVAVRLRLERAKGHAEGLANAAAASRSPHCVPGSMAEIARDRTPEDEARFAEYCHGLGRRSAAEIRQRNERRAVRDSLFEDCQREHDDSVLAGHPGFSGSGA